MRVMQFHRVIHSDITDTGRAHNIRDTVFTGG